MPQRESIRHEFVELIPDELNPGILYVSMEYATTAHLCMSGCGEEVVLPLSPEQWKLTFNGRTVSLSPSVGNWSFECQSHYWIENGTIRWAGQMSKKAVAATRERRATNIRSANRQKKRGPLGGMAHRVFRRLKS